MTNEQITKIVDTILSIHYNDMKMQEASDAYFKVMHPDSYAPIIDGNCYSALKILRILQPEISSWLSYFIYEVPLLKSNDTEYDVIVTQNGKEWKMNTVQELKAFLISEYAVSEKLHNAKR